MADEADMTADRDEREAPMRIAASRKPNPQAITALLASLEAAEAECERLRSAIAQPAGEAEPVYQVKQAIGASVWADASKDEFIEAVRHDLKRRILYTTPQQSQPLTDQQIEFLKFMDLLRVHHKTIEAWMLEQAGVEFTPLEQRKLAVAK